MRSPTEFQYRLAAGAVLAALFAAIFYTLLDPASALTGTVIFTVLAALYTIPAWRRTRAARHSNPTERDQ